MKLSGASGLLHQMSRIKVVSLLVMDSELPIGNRILDYPLAPPPHTKTRHFSEKVTTTSLSTIKVHHCTTGDLEYASSSSYSSSPPTCLRS